jgi:hypothetical protein
MFYSIGPGSGMSWYNFYPKILVTPVIELDIEARAKFFFLLFLFLADSTNHISLLAVAAASSKLDRYLPLRPSRGIAQYSA